MKARIPVDVEPLTEPRWARIRQAVYGQIGSATETPAPRAGARTQLRRVAWWGAAAAALVLALAASWKWHGAVATGSGLANPSRIATGSAGSHVVLDGMSLDLAPESAVVVNGDAARGVLVVLDRGRVTLDVEKRVAMAGFVVQAGEVSVRVVGTRFGVSRTDDAASVDVERGTVEVVARGKTVRVNAGETWPSFEPGAAASPPSSESRATSSPPLAQAEALTPDPAPAGSSGSRTKKHAAAPPAPRRRTEKAAASASDAVAEAAAPPSPASQELYESAARLEATDPARALALYRQVAGRRDSWLADALFAEGRLYAARGDKGQARATLTEYLVEFPRGPNAEDAHLLLDRTR